MKKNFIHQTKQVSVTLKTILLMLFVSIIVTFPASAGQQDKPAAKGPKPVGVVNSSNGGVYEKGQKPGIKCYERSIEKYQLTLRTGIFKNFDARLVIPFLNKETLGHAFPGFYRQGQARGIPSLSWVPKSHGTALAFRPFDMCVPIMVYRELNGIQLSEDYRVVAKLAIKF